jgi:hypothetical protein
VDISNGGVATLTGNTIVQGTNTQNYAMVAYDSEGLAYSNNSLLVQDNTFINYLPGGSIGVENFSGGNGDPPVYAQLIGNTFSDLSGDSPSNFQPLTGPGSITAASEPGTLPLLASALLLWPVMCRKRSAKALPAISAPPPGPSQTHGTRVPLRPRPARAAGTKGAR